jgi:hypothetical protein
MGNNNKSPGLFVRELPFLVLVVFWVIYAGLEIIRGRFDILSSVIPVGLFIIAYLAARWSAKGSGS